MCHLRVGGMQKNKLIQHRLTQICTVVIAGYVKQVHSWTYSCLCKGLNQLWLLSTRALFMDQHFLFEW